MKHLKKSAFYILLVVMSLTVQACPAGGNKMQQEQDSTNIAAKAKELKGYYAKAKSDDKEYQVKFFDAFPASFLLFNQLYGYNGNTYHVLYEESQKHVSLFCELRNTVTKEKYYEKLISLGLNGHWDADAVSYLQHCMEKYIEEDLPLTVSTLENYSDKEIKSFWYFLFDGPHPSETIPVDIDKIRSINDQIASLAEKAFQEVHEDAEPHGK